MKSFQGHGVRFDYHPSWKITTEVGADRTDITLTGPGTAIWIVSVIKGRPAPESLVTEAIGTFHDEYPTCDVYESQEAICLMPTVGKDLDFIHHDLISRVCVRACEGDYFSVLLIYQVSDLENDEFMPLLKELTDSLILDSDDLDDIDEDESDLPLFHYHNLFGAPPAVTDEADTGDEDEDDKSQ